MDCSKVNCVAPCACVLAAALHIPLIGASCVGPSPRNAINARKVYQTTLQERIKIAYAKNVETMKRFCDVISAGAATAACGI